MSLHSRYSNEWDVIVDKFIAQHDPFPGYWALSERAALSRSERRLVVPRANRLLDLGCGKGRLLARYAKSFDHVVAVEPNRQRLTEAMLSVKAEGIHNVEPINDCFEDCFQGIGTFDVILCSHVIQHIPTNHVQDMMQQIYFALAPGGSLILLTAVSRREDDTFHKWKHEVESPCVSDIEIGESEFDALSIENAGTLELPIHSFGRRSLRALMPSCQLTELRYFHALHPKNVWDKFVFRDKWINAPLFRGRHGIDALLTFKKD